MRTAPAELANLVREFVTRANEIARVQKTLDTMQAQLCALVDEQTRTKEKLRTFVGDNIARRVVLVGSNVVSIGKGYVEMETAEVEQA